MSSIYSALYYVYFMLRRALFIILVFSLHLRNSTVQVNAFIYCSILSCAIEVFLKPYLVKLENAMSFVNEMFILIAGQIWLLFSDILTPEERFNAGWAMISHVIFIAVFNIIVIVYQQVFEIIRIIKRIKERCNRKNKKSNSKVVPLRKRKLRPNVKIVIEDENSLMDTLNAAGTERGSQAPLVKRIHSQSPNKFEHITPFTEQITKAKVLKPKKRHSEARRKEFEAKRFKL